MAYRKAARRSTARRAPARRVSTRTANRSRGGARVAKRRTGGAAQTLRIVLEQPGTNSVARPGAAQTSVKTAARKAMF